MQLCLSNAEYRVRHAIPEAGVGGAVRTYGDGSVVAVKDVSS